MKLQFSIKRKHPFKKEYSFMVEPIENGFFYTVFNKTSEIVDTFNVGRDVFDNSNEERGELIRFVRKMLLIN